MEKTIITIEQLAHGQPRPHADSRYHARITAERHGVYANDKVIPSYMNEDTVKALARAFVHDFPDTPEWHQPTLKYASPAHPKTIAGIPKSSVWEVLIEQVYLD